MVLSPPYTDSPPGNAQVADTSDADHTANVLTEGDIPSARETTLSFAAQTPEPALRQTLDQLSEFAHLPDNWDSYGATPPTQFAVAVARQLLSVVHEAFGRYGADQVLPQSIAPLADGGVQLEWCTRGIDLDVQVGPLGGLGYLFADHRESAPRYREDSDSSWDTILRAIAAVTITGQS